MLKKTIVITGANGGLGQALAKFFASRGNKVILLGRRLDRVRAIAETIGPEAIAIACDVALPDSVRAAFDEIARRCEKIDVLINNAAIFRPLLIEDASDTDVVETISTNLIGPILCTKASLPLLRRGGQIINISSESIEEAFPHLTLYQASKGGLEIFSRHLKRELATRGIRVAVIRAGQMVGPGTSAEMSPEAGQRFFSAAMENGLNLVTRGNAQYQSTLDIFGLVLELPADVDIGTISFHGRPKDDDGDSYAKAEGHVPE